MRGHVLALALAGAVLSSLHVPAPPAAAPARPALTRIPWQDAAATRTVRRHLAQHRTGLVSRELDSLASTIVSEARHNDVPVELVLAVMHVESRYHAFAVSPVGALGIMQILPATGRQLARERGIPWYGPRTLFDPEVNVRLGVAYLKWLERRYGRLEVALAAYNWGPGRIDQTLRSGRPVPARYARDVLAALRARPIS